ncbi:protein kinase [Pseudomonas phage vB_PpuP-Luutsna-6]
MNRYDVTKVERMAVMAKAIGCMSEDGEYQKTRRSLTNAGFKHLGGGAFGSAWAHEDAPGWVVKLTSGDDNYAAYAYWGIANPQDGVPEFCYPAFDARRTQFMVMMPEYKDSRDGPNGWQNDYDIARSVCYAAAGCAPQPARSQLQHVCGQLGDFFKDLVSFDLHNGNIMYDSMKGFMVITDPICGSNTELLVSKATGRTYVEPVYDQQSLDLFGGCINPPRRRRLEEMRVPNFQPQELKAQIIPRLNTRRQDAMRKMIGFGNPAKNFLVQEWNALEMRMHQPDPSFRVNQKPAAPAIRVDGRTATPRDIQRVLRFLMSRKDRLHQMCDHRGNIEIGFMGSMQPGLMNFRPDNRMPSKQAVVAHLCVVHINTAQELIAHELRNQRKREPWPGQLMHNPPPAFRGFA